MKLADRIKQSLEEEFDKYVDDIYKTMKQEVHVRTGALQDSIRKEKKSKTRALVGVNGGSLAQDPRNASRRDYSMAYWKGHRSYTIVPVNAKALHWVDDSGRDVFAKRVTIPASDGDPFIERTIENKPKFGG